MRLLELIVLGRIVDRLVVNIVHIILRSSNVTIQLEYKNTTPQGVPMPRSISRQNVSALATRKRGITEENGKKKFLFGLTYLDMDHVYLYGCTVVSLCGNFAI
ncbi:uncharacterized protein LOC112493722 [Cephus cinctus]|uniref:Uncharacterized protein LOC112493722 n=1 Tax=Cephus cinctus TaxID=211228 RepID=A0AAJ7R8I7_CEPCN|nr:uncharacterized protein LOC112493722 [Cephus cinctus]